MPTSAAISVAAKGTFGSEKELLQVEVPTFGPDSQVSLVLCLTLVELLKSSLKQKVAPPVDSAMPHSTSEWRQMKLMLATMQSICEQVTQLRENGSDRTAFLRRVFAFEPSAAKWLEADRSDFLSTIDLRVALFLPTEYDR